MKTQLLPHEWMAVTSILLMLLLLALIALWDDEPSPSSTDVAQAIASQHLLVTIEGAVEAPGQYSLPLGSTVDDLVKLAIPTPLADLTRLKMTTRLRDGRHLTIREFPTITVTLSGAARQQGAIKIRRGTKLSELIKSMALEENADVTDLLTHDRRLRNGEVIEIP